MASKVKENIGDHFVKVEVMSHLTITIYKHKNYILQKPLPTFFLKISAFREINNKTSRKNLKKKKSQISQKKKKPSWSFPKIR